MGNLFMDGAFVHTVKSPHNLTLRHTTNLNLDESFLELWPNKFS